VLGGFCFFHGLFVLVFKIIAITTIVVIAVVLKNSTSSPACRRKSCNSAALRIRLAVVKTKTIGELLTTERQKRGLTIPQVVDATKIQPSYLIALEANQFEKLPSATFVKGFIKSLADFYSQDPQPLLATLRRDFKESAQGKLVPREFIRPVLKKQQLWTPLTMTFLFLGVIFLTLISYVGVQWYSFQKPPALEVTNPQEDQVVTDHVKVEGKTVPDAIVSVNAQPVSLYPDGTFDTEVLLPKDGTHIITIEAVDRRGKKSVIQRIIRVKQ
jgi:cytoskeletal protein RodZ